MIAISKSDLEKQRDILSRRRTTSAASWAIEEEELMDGLMNLLDKLLEGPGSWIHREEGEKDEPPTDEEYIEAARELHHKDGEVEVDDGAVVSRGDDPGAYVQAWVWVYKADVDPKYAELDDDEIAALPEGHCMVCGKHASDGSHSSCV